MVYTRYEEKPREYTLHRLFPQAQLLQNEESLPRNRLADFNQEYFHQMKGEYPAPKGPPQLAEETPMSPGEIASKYVRSL